MTIECFVDSLETIMATSPHDWGDNERFAWMWGIILGWDNASMDELAKKFSWSTETQGRLTRLHDKFQNCKASPDVP